MPKKAQLEKELKAIAKSQGAEFVFVRQGGKHEIWDCDGLTVPIPRHREIAEGTAKGIKKAIREHLGC